MDGEQTDEAAATPDAKPLATNGGERIASLDFIRGIAVLGIVVANIVAFGQPMAAYMYPDAFLVPHSDTEDWLWVAQFVAVDGKMRGLFTLLFGAGLYLFMERAWARGQTRWLQARRLFWLGLFGLAHYFLLWRGDILFSYAVSGMVAILFLRLSVRDQLVVGGLGCVAGAILYGAMMTPLYLASETELAAQPPFAEMREGLEATKTADLADGQAETAIIQQGRYGDFVAHNIAEHAGDLPFFVLIWVFETVPLMLIGMALYRMGLFSGTMDARRQRRWGWGALLVGGAGTLALALAMKAQGLTYYGTQSAFVGFVYIPRLLMTLGLATLLALWGNRARGWLARRLAGAGRVAFTNYLGTSMAMVLVFHGFGLGLFGMLGRVELYGVVLAWWVAMLAWPGPWLSRFRYGPLEWLWRCLTYWRLFPLRR